MMSNKQMDLTEGRDAPDRFERRVTDMLSRELGEKIDGSALEEIVGLLILFGSYFGATFEEMSGDPGATSDVERRGLARQLAAAWAPRSKKDGHETGGRGLNPRAVVLGLKRAVENCQSFPTEGLLFAFIQGASPHYWPGLALKGSEATSPAGLGPMAAAGVRIATRWAAESKRKGIHPDAVTPQEESQRRASEIRETMGFAIPSSDHSRSKPEPGWDG